MRNFSPRFRAGLLAFAVLAFAGAASAALAPDDTRSIAAAEKAEDKGKPRRPVLAPDRREHAPTTASGDTVQALRQEIQRLRAEVDRCIPSPPAK